MALPERYSRRSFLKVAGAGTAAAGLGALRPAPGCAAPLRGRRSPNERVVVGVMGTGGRGLALAEYFATLPGAEVAYVSDVDRRRMEEAQQTVAKTQARRPAAVKDFRRFLDDRDVDAIVIASPDHWHAPAAILAASAGKHVYVEKPSSHNPHEGELLVQAAKRYDRVVQMGNQRRSWDAEREAIEQLRAGVVGPVHYARTWYANAREPIGRGRTTPVPEWLDYDLWQGPAPRTPYRDNVIHYNWHWFWNWGTGEAGNNAVHFLDLARWGLGVDYPAVVASTGGHHFDDDDQETPDTQVISMEFPGNRSIMWEGLSANRFGPGGSTTGVSFHGEAGTLTIEHDGYRVYDRAGKLVRDAAPATQAGATSLTGAGYDRDAPHLANFCDAIRTGEALRSPIEEGHKSTLLSLLGNIALRTGRTLHTDPGTGRIRNDDDAMALWSREYAPGWEPRV